MKIRLPVTLLLMLILAACAGQVAQPTTVPATTIPTVGVSSSTPTNIPAVNTQPATSTGSQANLSGKVTFKIQPGDTQASYEVAETFISQNNRINVAIGVTSLVNGEINADLDNPPATTMGPITVDISKLASDSSRRDNMIRQNFLESSRYPIATFKPTKIDGLPAKYQPGQDYTFTVTGDLTVHQVTHPVTFNITAKLDGNTLSGTATSSILMSDFGVGPISLAGMLNTEDKVKLALKFIAKP